MCGITVIQFAGTFITHCLIDWALQIHLSWSH